MILQSARPVLLSVLAILFGVVQVFCVCASAEAAIPAQETAQADHHVEVSFGLAHSILASGEQTAPEHNGQNDHDHSGDHKHDADCAHCDDASILVGANDVLTPITLPSLADEDFIASRVYAIPVTRAHMAPSALDGLRWLHPPSSTLVSLKIRLTI